LKKPLPAAHLPVVNQSFSMIERAPFILVASFLLMAYSSQGATVVGATRDAHVLQSDNQGADLDLLRVKDEIGGGTTNRKSWIAFDLSNPLLDLSSSATLSLTVGAETARGRTVSNPNLTISVFALNAGFTPGTGELGFDWSEGSISFSNAPGNNGGPNGADPADTTLIGSFFMPYGDPAGTVYQVNLPDPGNYVQADGSLTLILASASESDSNANLASSENETYNGPTLSLATIPEPSMVLSSLLGCVALLLRRRR
jgi:hypothetical protein